MPPTLSLNDPAFLSGGFSPRDLPSLKQWIKQDAGITLNGSNVSAWADQSGNGNHYIQATAARQPAYLSTGGPSGKAAVSFDGTDDLMNCAGFALVQPYTVALVSKQTINIPKVWWGGLDIYLYKVLPPWRIYGGPDGSLGIDSASNSPFLIWDLAVGVYNAATSRIYRNNDVQTIGSIGTYGFNGVTLGNYFTGADLYCQGVDVAELIVFGANLTDAEVGLLRGYLNLKYALY